MGVSLYVCLCNTWVSCASGGQRECGRSSGAGITVDWEPLWMLGIESESSERVTILSSAKPNKIILKIKILWNM